MERGEAAASTCVSSLSIGRLLLLISSTKHSIQMSPPIYFPKNPFLSSSSLLTSHFVILTPRHGTNLERKISFSIPVVIRENDRFLNLSSLSNNLRIFNHPQKKNRKKGEDSINEMAAIIIFLAPLLVSFESSCLVQEEKGYRLIKVAAVLITILLSRDEVGPAMHHRVT